MEKMFREGEEGWREMLKLAMESEDGSGSLRW